MQASLWAIWFANCLAANLPTCSLACLWLGVVEVEHQIGVKESPEASARAAGKLDRRIKALGEVDGRGIDPRFGFERE
jgi:hypothetical protein